MTPLLHEFALAEVGAADQTNPVDLDRPEVAGSQQLVDRLTGSR
jgi:hypothetical protein